MQIGGRPRTLPIPGWDLKNVFVLRTPNDANAIAKQAKERHVVIFGASFIGMELASTLVSKAKSVSVCDFFSVPFERVLGTEVRSIRILYLVAYVTSYCRYCEKVIKAL